jgi:hypothetical protein
MKEKEKHMSKPTRKDIADVILGMTYGELVQLGESLVAIQRKRKIDSADEIAALLNEWANAQ